MVKGLYTSAVGMMARQNLQNIISNNLANANTVGYKKDELSFRNELGAELLLNKDPNVSPAESVRTDFQQAQLAKTDNSLDFAIDGTGFFEVFDTTGTFYTRDGNFVLDEGGELKTQTGQTVMGESGPIILPALDFSINADGDIFVEGQSYGRLKVVDFEDRTVLRKAGKNLFVPADNATEPVPVSSRVLQGYLEESNVNPIDEMVQMILTVRSFSQGQKSIQAQDETIRRVVDELGRV